MIEQVKKGYEAVKSGFVTLKNHAITSGKDLLRKANFKENWCRW